MIPSISMISMTSLGGFFAHLSGVTAVQIFFPDTTPIYYGRFFTLELPLIVMQALVQIPLFLLMVNGIIRIFSLPNSLAWSKGGVIFFCAFLLFMANGFFVADCLHVGEFLRGGLHARGYLTTVDSFFLLEVSAFIGMFVGAGIIASFFCVPTYFKRTRYLIQIARSSQGGRPLFDDGATSLFALLLYVCLGGLCFIPYLIIKELPVFSGSICWLMFSSYILAFAGFLEFCRLSRFRNNRIFFVTVMVAWWVLIPWLAAAMSGFRFNNDVAMLAAVVSPFYGVSYGVSFLLGKNLVGVDVALVAFLVAGLAWLLAYRELGAVRRQVAGQCKQ